MRMRQLTYLLVPATALTLAGCNGSEAPEPTAEAPASAEPHEHAGEDAAHQHAHGTEGPHGGQLVELGGGGAYHAELVHEEQTGAVTVYLLDGDAESAVAVAAPELTVNLQHDGQGKQFKLAAQPQPDDAPGKSSRFVASDGALGEELDHEHGSAQLVVEIAGQQYRGAIEHHHGHEGHEHSEHAGHDHR